jgi:GNAT superfamily N-acetyltransferase
MRPGEERAFLDIHTRSIRGLAASHYTPEVIEAWVVPMTEEYLRAFVRNQDNEIRLVAELDGVLVGLGCLVVQTAELRACYVVPEAARKGIGRALVGEIERIARERGLDHLHLEASINAEPFYSALGYEVVERGVHVWPSGQRMAAVTMRRVLRGGA